MERQHQAADELAETLSAASGLIDHSRLHVAFQNLRDVLESAPLAVIITNAEGVIEYVNEYYERATGYTRKQAIGHRITAITSDVETNAKACKTLAAGEGWQGEVCYPRADGSTHRARASIQPMKSSDGSVSRYIGLQVEVSEQTPVERELTTRQAYWQALGESAPSFIGIVDREGRIKAINRVVDGISREDVEGTSVFDYPLPEYQQVWREALSAAIDRGEQRSFEYAATMGPGGPITWFHSAIGPVDGQNGIDEAVVITTDLSDRRHMEDALREREAYWRVLVESAPAFIVTLDEEGTMTNVNREIDGGRPEDAVGHSLFEFAEEAAHQTIRDALQRVFRHGETVHLENRAALTSGEVRSWSYTIGPITDGDVVVSAILVSHDITERKTAEAKLLASEEQWRALLENAPDYILIVDRNGCIEHLNRAGQGVIPGDLMGQSVLAYTDEAYHEDWRQSLARVFADGELVTIEARSRNMSEPRWFSISIGPVFEGTEVKCAVVIARDVTARRTAEERIRAVATAVPDLIVVADAEGVLHEVLGSENGHGLMHVPAHVLRGQRIQSLVPPEQSDAAIRFVRDTIEGGQPLEDEYLFDLPGGPTWISGRSAPLILNDGRVVAVIHVSDISQRKRMEEELAALREEVEAHAEAGYARATEYGLTFREVTVLDFIARGRSDKEIAGLLGVSPFTVNKQSASAVRKLKARSRSEAVARAVRVGII